MESLHSPAFTARIEALLEEHHVPGIAIALVQGDTTVSAGFGLASLDPPSKFTPDTLVDIASASKSLTGASLALLVEDDRYPDVKWEATMSSLLPEDFVMSGEGYTEGVTVDDVIGHRTGLPRHDTSVLNPSSSQPDNSQSVTRNLRNLAVAAPLRSTFIYCNMMYTIATHLVEHTTGLTFADFLAKHFFEPLDMSSTGLQASRVKAKGLGERIEDAHHWDNDNQSDKAFQNPDSEEEQGAGSIVTSVNDYVKYVKALTNQEHPFTEAVYNGILKSRTLSNPEYNDLNPYTSPTAYAAGWEVSYYRGHMIVCHDGAIPGIGTHHFFLPGQKFGGVILGNSGGAKAVTAILAQELIDDVLNLPKEERPDWNKIERAVSESLPDTEAIRQKLSPGIKDSEPQKMPLSAYTGEYWNPGYHGMKVEIKDGKLFVDARDRSFRFTLTFDHVCGQTKYVAHICDYPIQGDEPIKAEFRFENDVAVKMGLHLELALDDYIWFDRVQES